MTDKAILAIDQGTTSSRAILFSPQGDILFTAQKELTLFYPENGWVEQDAMAIWQDVLACCRDVLKKAGDVQVVGIGITNQRETTVLWDRKTGKPISHAIVWQDRRTADFCRSLKTHEQMVQDKTGLLLDPYFSATKVRWILDHVEGARQAAEAGDIAFGTVDSFLLWHLTGGRVHATDATNAARTMLYNIRTQQWDDDLLKLFDVPRALLPEVMDNCTHFGVTADGVLETPLTIGGMAGDQQAALIGQACFSPGMVKSTYGTGCFALMHIGQKFKISENRLLTTTAYRLNGEASYAIEGSIFVAGAAMQWLRDGLGFFEQAKDSEALALSVPDNGGVYFVPAFTGLGAPHWNPEARGIIAGLTRASTKAHITRAALEAQAYQTLDLMAAMIDDGGTDPAVMRVDGGLVANGLMCQFLSDMIQKPVEVPRVTETTALGAAYLAGLYAGVYEDLDALSAQWSCHHRYTPSMDGIVREQHYAGWKKALNLLKS